MRVTGFNSLVSASDTSHAVTALLERDSPTSSAADKTSSEADDRKAMVDAFNCAYDSLSPHFEPSSGVTSGSAEGYDTTTLVNGGNLSSSAGLGAGILQARALQNSITQLAVGLVERRAITLLRHFRYAYVTSNTVGETQFSRNDIISSNNANNAGNDRRDHIFSKPLALTRLASYLMDMHRENGKWTGSKARPLVLIAEKPKSDTCLVVGYEYPERHGSHVRNNFGKHFEMTANSMNGTFKFDHFDSNVVEVAGADVQRFLEQLHYMLDSL
jgi:CDC45-like protein